MMLNNNKKKY